MNKTCQSGTSLVRTYLILILENEGTSESSGPPKDYLTEFQTLRSLSFIVVSDKVQLTLSSPVWSPLPRVPL